MSKTPRGLFVILCAAFVWGVGNAVTGLTAQTYFATGSLFPAIDIALANTIGGCLFVILSLCTKALFFPHNETDNVLPNQAESRFGSVIGRSVLSGVLKGANTCLFVFSTTYIVATQSLVLESTYILWSLIFCLLFTARKFSLASTFLRTVILCVGVVLVANPASLRLNGIRPIIGAIFGLCAGLSYALFLLFWSRVTSSLVDLRAQLRSTSYLLCISGLSIVLLAELASLLFLRSWWFPLTNIRNMDLFIQLFNGAFVVGLTYLLVTVGMAQLKDAQGGSSFIAAFGLSFSIPFTLLPELIIHKFAPTAWQGLGIFLFMIGFALMSVSISRDK